MAKKKLVIEPVKFVNPFTKGVSYDDFLAAIPERVTVEEYCENDLTQDELDYLKRELSAHESNQRNQQVTTEEEETTEE